ncbi:MAG TPA: phosphoribosylamine--glycine ligase [Chloroflexota bacterium]|nr:phosphoribosylamine--glycine ligase [Chloroflexota bacterium]
MRVLVVGSGAREHALAWRLGLDGADVVVAPGNGGTPANAPLSAGDVGGLADVAARERFDLTVVGPEGPLAAGLVDTFSAQNLPVFGPSKQAARLEWSKAWAKAFLVRYGIPTGTAEIVVGQAEARRVISRTGLPVVIKADGLAGGKGVFVIDSAEEVDEALRQCQAFGECMLIEECLSGPELSVLAFADGERLALMPPARDYKRVFDGDRGPNTGGMGGRSWPSDATSELLEFVEQRVLRPTLDGMAAEGVPYRGVLYAGLMLTADGPRVLEFNCRLGDPECQLILPLLDSSLLEVLCSAAAGRLEQPRWRKAQTFGVVLASAGYPEAPRTGDSITGLDALPPGVHAFHAGTAVEDGDLVTAGGRVMTLVSESRADVYAAAERVNFSGKHFRRDIGLEAAVAATR